MEKCTNCKNASTVPDDPSLSITVIDEKGNPVLNRFCTDRCKRGWMIQHVKGGFVRVSIEISSTYYVPNREDLIEWAKDWIMEDIDNIEVHGNEVEVKQDYKAGWGDVHEGIMETLDEEEQNELASTLDKEEQMNESES